MGTSWTGCWRTVYVPPCGTRAAPSPATAARTDHSEVEGMTAKSLLWVDIAAKAALALLLLHAVVFPDLPQYHGKAIGTRLATYPISALIVPAIWLAGRRRWQGRPYP